MQVKSKIELGRIMKLLQFLLKTSINGGGGKLPVLMTMLSLIVIIGSRGVDNVTPKNSPTVIMQNDTHVTLDRLEHCISVDTIAGGVGFLGSIAIDGAVPIPLRARVMSTEQLYAKRMEYYTCEYEVKKIMVKKMIHI